MSAAVVERVPFDPAKSRCRRLVRTVRAAADWLEREADTVARLRGRRGCRKTFLTLTYREVRGWQPRHISEFLHCLRQWFRDSAEIRVKMPHRSQILSSIQ